MSITKPLSQLSPGQRVGPYTIQHLIGRGRQAEVYRASRTGSRSDVAVKVFLPGVIRGPSHATCFLEEAARLASLVHPHIARVYDFGAEHERELYFIAMEFLPGGTLRDSIAAHPSGYPRDDVLRLFTPIVDAVAAAHDQGIVHANLRPEQILLGADGRPVLTDFATSCLDPATPPAQPFRLSAIAYWAPEQAAQLQPTPAVDVYALGVLLHELAVGDVPFKGSTRDEIVAQHLYEAPVPPSQRKAGLDPRIERVIQIALQKNPKDRFVSVREMVALLNSASGDDYATLNLDKRLTRDVRRRSEENAFRKTRAAPTPQDDTLPPKPASKKPWLIIGTGIGLGLAALALLLL